MANKEILEYIKTQRALGLHDETIKQNLLIAGGWTLDDIEDVIANSAPREKPKNTSVTRILFKIFVGLVICLVLIHIGIFTTTNISILSTNADARNKLNTEISQAAEIEKLAKTLKKPIFGQVVVVDASGLELERVQRVFEQSVFVQNIQSRGFSWINIQNPQDNFFFYDLGNSVNIYVSQSSKEDSLYLLFDQQLIATTTLDKLLKNTSVEKFDFMNNWWIANCDAEGYVCESKKFRENEIDWIVFLHKSPTPGSFALGVRKNVALMVQSSGVRAYYRGDEAFIDLIKSIY